MDLPQLFIFKKKNDSNKTKSNKKEELIENYRLELFEDFGKYEGNNELQLEEN